MNLSKISVVSMPVSDQQAAKAYYRDVLGFEVTVEMPFSTGLWIMMKLPGSETAITLVNWFPQMPPGSLQGMVIETGDIEAAHRALVERGARVTGIESQPWGRYVTLTDPDGNGLVIQQSSPPA